METMIGAIFVISMLILVAAFFFFVLRGTSVAAEDVEDAIYQARAANHEPEPGAAVNPPATGLMMDKIPSKTKSPSPG